MSERAWERTKKRSERWERERERGWYYIVQVLFLCPSCPQTEHRRRRFCAVGTGDDDAIIVDCCEGGSSDNIILNIFSTELAKLLVQVNLPFFWESWRWNDWRQRGRWWIPGGGGAQFVTDCRTITELLDYCGTEWWGVEVKVVVTFYGRKYTKVGLKEMWPIVHGHQCLTQLGSNKLSKVYVSRTFHNIDHVI